MEKKKKRIGTLNLERNSRISNHEKNTEVLSPIWELDILRCEPQNYSPNIVNWKITRLGTTKFSQGMKDKVLMDISFIHPSEVIK